MAYQALEEFTEHEIQALGEGQYLAGRVTGQGHNPIVAARMDRKPWLVIQYYEDWRKENALSA